MPTASTRPDSPQRLYAGLSSDCEIVYTAKRGIHGQITDFQVLSVNAAAEQQWQRSESSVLGQCLGQLVSEADAQFLTRQFALVVDSGRSVRLAIDMIRPDGEIIHQPDVLILKQHDGVLTTFRPATDPELERDQQSTILQQIADSIEAGLLMARPFRNELGQITNFRIVLVNEFSARLAGSTVSKMTGQFINDVCPGFNDSDLFRYSVRAIETGQKQRIVLPHGAYGVDGCFMGTFYCIDNSLFYTLNDITDLKAKELVAQQKNELLEQVMNTTLTAIVVHESVRNEAGELIDFRLTQLNQVAADLLREPIEAAQNQLLSRYFPGIEQTPVFEKYRQVVQTGQPARFELYQYKRWYNLSATRFGDGMIVSVLDITHIHRYQQQLESINHELKRSNQNLESFAFVASHDLQEPLRKITSFANILHTQYAGQFDAGATDIIRRVNDAAERMRLLIQDILTYSQVDRHRDVFKAVDLTQLIKSIEETELWTAIYKSRAEVFLRDLPILKADASQVRRLFQNLLSNAVKFCPKDEKPIVTISSRVVGRHEIPEGLLLPSHLGKRVPAGGDYYEIAVSDNGIGFDLKHLERIFQVFHRLNSTSKYPGSGIGLAICHKIVEHHAGAITARSTPGEGSTFLVYLPV